MSLPIFHTGAVVEPKDFLLMQTNWSAQLNPMLKGPLSSGLFLLNVVLANGLTVINHTLGRVQQGWMISDINGAATIYRSAAFNNLTLNLTSNAVVTVNLYVF